MVHVEILLSPSGIPARRQAGQHMVGGGTEKELVSIPVHAELPLPVEVMIQGNLIIPGHAKGIVIFAHGSGSGLSSPRNRLVAQVLHNVGFASLLLDLLTTDEKKEDLRYYQFRFDIGLLGKRLIAATDWLRQSSKTQGLNVGYFATSTGAAAALIAASANNSVVRAIVSRGGRPDLVDTDVLRVVRAPTLFIVGGNDEPVITWTKGVLKDLCMMKEKKLVIIAGATHLFEEPGSLDEVASLASSWFRNHLMDP